MAEKVWFVHIDGKQVGPLSVDEMRERISSGKVNAAHHVWSQGMASWSAITDVDDWRPFFSSQKSAQAGGARDPGRDGKDVSVLLDVRPGDLDDRTEALDMSALRKARKEAQKVQKKEASSARGLTGSMAGALKWLMIVGVIVGLGTFLQNNQGLVKEVWDQVFSPVGSLDDVTPAEKEELKQVIRLPIGKAKPSAAIALSSANPEVPVFYIGTNLPDGANFDMLIRGVPSMLPDGPQPELKLKVQNVGQFVKTQQIRRSDGKPFARGEYAVWLFESDQQPEKVSTALAQSPMEQAAAQPAYLPKGRKVLVSRRYFLGGKRDAAFEAKLTEFHQRAIQKAKSEAGEFIGVSSQLRDHLGATVQAFDLDRREKNRKLSAKRWAGAHDQWLALDQTLGQKIQSLPVGQAQELALKTLQAVEGVHALQNFWFNGKVDLKSFDGLLSQARTEAQLRLTELQAKAEQLMASSSDPTQVFRDE